MFEISITWWKAKGDPDPDQTPEWTSVIPGTHAATPRNTVARLQKLFKCAEGYSRSCRWGPSTRGAFSSGNVYLPGNIEKGTPAQSDFAPANRPFPSTHGDLVPAMRVRYVANDDFNFRYGGQSEARMDEAILKRFGKPSWVSDKYYVPAEDFLARRLIGASVLWRDAHHVWFCLPCIAGEEVEKLEYEPQLELWPARTPFEKSFVYAELEKKLSEYLPAWYLKKTVMGLT